MSLAFLGGVSRVDAGLEGWGCGTLELQGRMDGSLCRFLGGRISRGECGSLWDGLVRVLVFGSVFGQDVWACSPSTFLTSSSVLKIATKLCCSLLLIVSGRFKWDSFEIR